MERVEIEIVGCVLSVSDVGFGKNRKIATTERWRIGSSALRRPIRFRKVR